MATTRVFVRGLPPLVSEEDFRNHFAKRYSVTDIKLLGPRRIGYVGFKSQEDAVAAAKYFNRSFLRMSKIGVELVDNERFSKYTAPGSTSDFQLPNNPLKRKHDQDDGEAASRRKITAVPSQGSSETATHTNSTDLASSAPPLNPRALPAPHTEPKAGVEDQGEAQDPVIKVQGELDEDAQEPSPLSDQDWIRSRTSRLLGLIDDDEEEEVPSGNTEEEAKSSQAETSLPLDHPQQPSQPPEGDQDDTVSEKHNETGCSPQNEEGTLDEVRQSKRLFLRNLAYTVREDDIADLFASFGPLEEIHVPIDSRSGETKGIAFALFEDSERAVSAYQSLDGIVFQGRILHILPAAAKREKKLDDFALSRLPLKKQRQIQRKSDAASTFFNWNAMYMNADAVISSVSERLGVPKSELIDPTSSDAAVKQAQAETHVIHETKTYFQLHGVDLNAFGSRHRGDTAILVKNFSYGTTREDLSALFGQYGELARVLIPPTGTIAIVEFRQAPAARSAFSGLAYRKFNDSVLFLEKAPKDLFTSDGLQEPARDAADTKAPNDASHESTADEPIQTTTLFVRNLNFKTTSQRFLEAFKPIEGLVSARVKTKTDAKRSDQVLSMGFGFLEFQTSEQAKAALSAMDGYELDGHRLLIRASHKGHDAAQERRREDQDMRKKNKKSKIIIKNLPFEASKKDVRELFRSYGQLRAVRLPKKFDNTRKGYAFAEFTTPREAHSAIGALRDTHLLGRRLVLDFAAGEAEDPEKEIEKMQQKVGKQSNNMALRKLTAASERKKFVADDEGQGE